MFIQPLTASARHDTNTTTGTSTPSSDTTAMFMKLLTTELKSQDPTQTMDPTTMVTQMVQINQLNDVAGIYSILQNQARTAGVADAAQSSHSTPGGN